MTRAADPRNFLEVPTASDAACGRANACVQTVWTLRANAIASDVISVPCPRPPFETHHHKNNFLNSHAHVSNVVPKTPVYSNSPKNEGRNFNARSTNVPDWNRSVDILKALHNAVPHNSCSQVDDRNVRLPNAMRPIFDVQTVSSEGTRESYQRRDVGNFLYKPEEPRSSCTCIPVSIPRVSSWSFSKKTAPNTPVSQTNRIDFETAHLYKNSMFKIQSADNIRRLQFINAIPSTSGQTSVYPQNNNDTNAIYCQHSSRETICHQPRENNKNLAEIPLSGDILGGKNHILPNPAKNSVVHWTNSVENRVCCPETVLYGAVYGLKCLK